MSGCCPPSPPSSVIGGAFSDANGPESDIRNGETVECAMARAGNTTGLQDDATGNVDGKIDNNSVPLTRSGANVTTNVQFQLTAGSTRTATTWTISPSAPPGLTFTTGGLLSGTFSSLDQVYSVTVTAADGSGNIDTRGYTIAPSAKDDEIKLICPLPGGIINSKYGMRLHPIQHVMKMHTGVDLKMLDRSVKDVVAACDGEVLLAGGNPSTGYGLHVWLKHVTSSGTHICNTTYNHLNKIYVTVGQKVMAGQAIGLEGKTGASTGNHLHFEVKLPDGKFIDPEPLINGSLTVAGKTLANGDPDLTSTASRSSAAGLTAAESRARQDSCILFGPSYPAAIPPESSDATPAGSSTDPFELAWYFTMKAEVGSFWATAPGGIPTDADIVAGSIGTASQRTNCGYVNTPKYPGGETKFGIAQKPNPGLTVRTATYAECKNTGFNNYWESSKMSCGDKSKLVSIMLFDMNYLHGPGNAKQMFLNAGITSTTGDSHDVQLAQVQALYDARVAFIRRIPNQKFTNGWLNRANACLAYVQSL